MLAVANGKPETMGLVSVIRHNVQFQYELATRKYTTLLKKEQDKCEIQEGLIKACDVIDLIIEILRGSKNIKQAKKCLITGETEGIKFKSKLSEKTASMLHFSERQATAILEMRLYKLIGLEIEALMAEHEETLKNIALYQEILGSRAAMAKVIIKELKALKKEFSHPRLTVIDVARDGSGPYARARSSRLYHARDKKCLRLFCCGRYGRHRPLYRRLWHARRYH